MYARLAHVLSRRAGLRLFRFYSRPLRTDETLIFPRGVQLRAMPERDVLALCADAALDLAAENVSRAYANGDLCIAGLVEGRVAGYCWLAFSPLHHLDGVWVEFDGRTAWVYKTLVLPPHRGRGIAAALYRFADALCIDRRRDRSLICAESHNRRSMAAARRAGYTAAGHAGYWLRGRKLFTWRSADAKRTGVRFYVPPAER